MMEGLRNEIRMQLENLFEDSLSLGRPIPNEVVNSYINHRLDKIMQIIRQSLDRRVKLLLAFDVGLNFKVARQRLPRRPFHSNANIVH